MSKPKVKVALDIAADWTTIDDTNSGLSPRRSSASAATSASHLSTSEPTVNNLLDLPVVKQSRISLDAPREGVRSPHNIAPLAGTPFLNEGFLDEEVYKKLLSSTGTAFNKALSDSAAAWKGAKISSDRLKARLKLKFLIRKGIPDHLRSRVWMTVTGANESIAALKSSKTSAYKDRLFDVFGSKVPDKILKPALFGGELSVANGVLVPESEMVAKRILCVLGMDFPDIKFSPLVPEVVMLLLHFLPEESAYFTTQAMMTESQVSHRYFHLSTTDFNLFLLTFGSTIKKCLPKIYYHMKKKLNLNPKSFCNNWFKRLFIGELPFRTVLRLFDVYLNEGGRVLYRLALGILSSQENVLLRANDVGSFCSILQQYLAQLLDDDKLFKTSFKISLHPNSVTKFRKQNQEFASLTSSPHIPHHVYYRPKLSQNSSLIPEELFEVIYEWIPMRYRITDPVLLFASYKDGFSFKTMYKKIYGLEPLLFVFKSDHGRVFGAYVSDKWRLTGKWSTLGTRETFLFTIVPEAKRYNWQVGNIETFVTVDHNNFCVGSGDGVGLMIDDEWEGSSAKCQTFNNEPLNGPGKSDRFVIVSVEVWGLE